MKTRQDYETALGIVRSVVTEWDPYRLIGRGSPKDEFDAEIAGLVTRIRNVRSPRDAALAISDVFSAAFGPHTFSPEECAEVGAQLYTKLQQAGALSHDA